MIDTEWGQWSGFNRFCPTGCPAGCSAVAMAQVLWYWKCRIESDWGSYTWKYMNLYTSDDDNASLIYHCGLACDTNYDTDGSTSTPNKIKNGLNDHMGCKSDVDVIWQNSHLLDWRDWLEDEIDQERPIIYNAGNFEFAGHSWVISGYDSTGDFFCNWGWNGDYNGYFSLGDFSTPNGSFNTFDSAVIKIIPEQDNGVATPQIQEYSLTYNPNGNIITTSEVFGATSYEWETSYGTIVGTGTSATLFSDCSLVVVKVRAYNENCEIYSPYYSKIITINYGTISGPSIVCSSGGTFSISNIPAGASIIWNASSNITRVSPQDSNPCTFTANYGNSEGWIGAQIGGCVTVTLPNMPVRTGINASDFSFEVWDLDGRLITTEYGLDILCPNTTYNIYVVNNGECSTSDYTWQIPSWWTQIEASKNRIQINTNSDPSGTVSVNAITCCSDESQLITGDFALAYYCYNLRLTPNPATDETTLELLDASGIKADVTWDVEVYDQLQILKLKTDKSKKSNFKINTSNWKDGVYIVRVNIGKEIISGKLVVKH